jgi:hypothetical protein
MKEPSGWVLMSKELFERLCEMYPSELGEIKIDWGKTQPWSGEIYVPIVSRIERTSDGPDTIPT